MTVVWPKKVQASRMFFENMPTAEARLLRSKYPNQIPTPIKLKSRISQYTLCQKKRNTNTGRKRLLGHRSALVSAWLIAEKGSPLCMQSNAFRGRRKLQEKSRIFTSEIEGEIRREILGLTEDFKGEGLATKKSRWTF
ncbi:phytochrome interacting factor 3-like 2 [Striga asiatica]|uniref:Phytochrome interacting factor 3-like 2 n=1 Tax=Striga asiatica TaxID=4170 RepID=A0A5A7PUA5_STRAF|nr:phytochrome interacting factor 3-like 2 [Striga asiatica]